ncbi:TRAP transporter substrate-binding protein [Chloroflexota bacterium]
MLRKTLITLSASLMVVVLLSGLLVGCSSQVPATSTVTATTTSTATTTKTATETATKTATATATTTTVVKQTVLKASTHSNTNHPAVKQLQYFADLVKERTGGQVEIEIHDSGSLIGGKDVLNATRSGIVDLGFLVTTYWPTDFPFTNDIAMEPFACDGWDSTPEIMELVRPIKEKELNAQNMTGLFEIPFNNEFFFKKRVDPSNPDWSGMKIRDIGGNYTRIIETFGGTPISMSSTEMPMALTTGLIQGMGTSFASYESLDMYDVVPYAYLTGAFYTFGSVEGMNLDAWNKLSPDIQKILLDAGKDAESFYIDLNKGNDLGTLEKIKAHPKAELIVLTAEQRETWQNKLAHIWDIVPDKYGEEGKKFVDALRSVR